MEDRGKSEIDLLREELVELRTELEQLKAEDEADEREPKRPNLRLIQGGLLAGAVGGWLWHHRRHMVAALATGAASSAAIVLVPDDYGGPGDLQVPIRTPASAPPPEPTAEQTRSPRPATHHPAVPGARPTARAPTREPDEAFKTPATVPPAVTVPEIPTIPTPLGTVTPTVPRLTVGAAEALPGPAAPTGGGSCRATIVTVTICIPPRKP